MDGSDEIHPVEEIQTSRLLRVEGADDEAVVEQILKKHHIVIPAFSIEKADGYDNLLNLLEEADLVEPNRESVGIVVDADQNLEGRWMSLKRCLAQVGVQLPNVPDPQGTIVETVGKPKVGVWLMPDNMSLGELEDFVADMIPDNDPVWPRSQSYIDGIPHDQRKFKRKVQRAKVYAWLATREKPGFMGQAIDRKDLDVNGILCQRFVAWLTELFG